MLPAFKLQILFGLFVLCIYHTLEAQMNPFRKTKTNPFTQPPLRNPSISGNIFQRPLPSTSAMRKSIELLNLQSKPPSPSASLSSKSDVYRTVSLPSLNTAKTSAIMVETVDMHKQAASILNIPHRTNPFSFQRMWPNSQTMKIAAKYLKNSAIGVAGVGGVISVTNFFTSASLEKENKKNNSENVNVGPIKSTTISEITNPIGMDI